MKKGNRLLTFLLSVMLAAGTVQMPVIAGEYSTAEAVDVDAASEGVSTEAAASDATVDADSVGVPTDETAVTENEESEASEASDDTVTYPVSDTALDTVSGETLEEGSGQAESSDDSYDPSPDEAPAENEQQEVTDDNAGVDSTVGDGDVYDEELNSAEAETIDDSVEENSSVENKIQEGESEEQTASITPEQIRAFQEKVKVWKYENQIAIVYDSVEEVQLGYSIYSGMNDELMYSGNLAWNEQSNFYYDAIDFDAVNEARKADDEITEEITIKDIPVRIVIDDGVNLFEESISSDLGTIAITEANNVDGQLDLEWESNFENGSGYSVIAENAIVQVYETADNSILISLTENENSDIEVTAHAYDENTGVKYYCQADRYEYSPSIPEEPATEDESQEEGKEEQEETVSAEAKNAGTVENVQEANKDDSSVNESTGTGATDEVALEDFAEEELVSTEAMGAASFVQTEYNGHVYQLFNEGVTWSVAKSRCENRGGHLVTITDAAEHNFCKSLLGNLSPKYCWIGASHTSGTWKWVTGETWGYTDWSPTSPNGSGGGTHIEMQNWPGISRAWNWDDQGDSGTSPSKKYQGAPYYHLTKNYCYICEWDYKVAVTIGGPSKGVANKQIILKATIVSSSLAPTKSNITKSAKNIDSATGTAKSINWGTLSVKNNSNGEYVVSIPVAFSGAGKYNISVSFNGVSGEKNIIILPEKISNVRWNTDSCGHNDSNNIGTVHRRLSICWDSLENISGYKVQVSSDPDFTSGKTSQYNITSISSPTYLDSTERESETSWYVRVAAYYNGSTGKVFTGEWSDSFKASVCAHLLPCDFWGISNTETISIPNDIRRTFYYQGSGELLGSDGSEGTCFGNVIAGLTALSDRNRYYSYLNVSGLRDIRTYAQNDRAREMIYLAHTLTGNVDIYEPYPKNDLQHLYNAVLEYTKKGGIPISVSLGGNKVLFTKIGSHSILLLDIVQDKDNKVVIRAYDSNYRNEERTLTLYYTGSHNFTKWEYKDENNNIGLGSIGNEANADGAYIWMANRRKIQGLMEMMDSYLLHGRDQNEHYQAFSSCAQWPDSFED